MKNIFAMIVLLLLPFKFCLAQDLNMAKVAKDWDKIKADFVKELKNDPEIKAVYSDKLNWKITHSPIFFEIKKTDYGEFNFNEKVGKKYDEIRKAYLEKLAKDPKYSIPKGDEKDDLLKKCESKIESLQQEIETQKANIDSLKTQLRNKEKSIKETQDKSFFDTVLDNWIIYLIALLGLIGVVVLLILLKKANKESDELSNEVYDLKDKISSLKNQKPKEKIVEKIVEKTVEKPIEKIVYVEKTKKEDKPKEYKYLCQINGADGGYFKRVQNTYDGSSSYYRMFDEKDGEAEFEFFGDAERAIKKWSSILDSVSEYEGDTDTATKIKTEEPGKVKYDSAHERWKVIKKAKLNLY